MTSRARVSNKLVLAEFPGEHRGKEHPRLGSERRRKHPLGSRNGLNDSRLRELACEIYFFVDSSPAFFMNGVNRSIGIGMNVVVLCSLAISDIVCR